VLHILRYLKISHVLRSLYNIPVKVCPDNKKVDLSQHLQFYDMVRPDIEFETLTKEGKPVLTEIETA